MRAVSLLLGLIVAASCRPAAEARHARALWDVVHGLCVVDKRLTGLPMPCTAVDLARGVAVVKDIGPTGHLLVPTRRITGIEDPAILAPATPDYWQLAWAARRFVERSAGRKIPRDMLALAINSRMGRSQDQLHIHVDCVQRDVRRALADRGEGIGTRWSMIDLRGHPYHVRSLADGGLATRSPFRLLAEDGPEPGTPLGEQTMAIVGAWLPDGAPGFYLVAARQDASNHGHGEELLDHRCAVLR